MRGINDGRPRCAKCGMPAKPPGWKCPSDPDCPLDSAWNGYLLAGQQLGFKYADLLEMRPAEIETLVVLEDEMRYATMWRRRRRILVVLVLAAVVIVALLAAVVATSTRHSTITRSARIQCANASSTDYTMPCGKPTYRTHDRVIERARTRHPTMTPSRTNNTRNYLLVEQVVLLPSVRANGPRP